MLIILISICSLLKCEPGSSDSIVSGYGLEDRAIEVQSPEEEKRFFLQPLCPDGLSCPLGAGGPFPGGKARPRLDADHSPPSSAEDENE
jgi:hypothetical protein